MMQKCNVPLVHSLTFEICMPKILLIISILFIAAASFFGYVTWQQKIPALKQALVAAQGDLSGKGNEIAKAKEEVKAAKAQVETASQEAKAAKSDLLAAQNEVKTQKAKVETITADNKNLADQITALGAKAPVENVVKAPVVDDTKVKTLEAQVAELQQVNQTMTTKVAEVQAKVKPLEEELSHYKGQARAKGLEGQVLAFNPAYNFVVLSLGDRHGVVMNAEVVIFRGKQLVARAKVTSVEPATSIANIIPGEGSRDFHVLPGDRVIYSGT